MPAAGLRERGGYALRVSAVMLRRPLEAAERIWGRAEIVADRRRSDAPVHLEASPDWERQLHEAVGGPWPCPEADRFHERWSELERRLEGKLELGAGHDADPGLARAVWCLVRHSQAERVVETGVARGVMTSFILRALDVNERGHLWSIDLPPVKANWHAASGVAITEDLRARWTLLRGSSRRRLPGLLRDLGTIDVFIHDSLHTARNMRFEFARAWAALSSGGVLVADDVDANPAFSAFVRAHQASAVVAQEELKPGKFGVAFKSSAESSR